MTRQSWHHLTTQKYTSVVTQNSKCYLLPLINNKNKKQGKKQSMFLLQSNLLTFKLMYFYHLLITAVIRDDIVPKMYSGLSLKMVFENWLLNNASK